MPAGPKAAMGAKSRRPGEAPHDIGFFRRQYGGSRP